MTSIITQTKNINTRRIAHLGSLRRNVRGLLIDAQQLPRFAGHAQIVRENGVAGGHGGVDLPDIVQLPGVAVHDRVLGLENTHSGERTNKITIERQAASGSGKTRRACMVVTGVVQRGGGRQGEGALRVQVTHICSERQALRCIGWHTDFKHTSKTNGSSLGCDKLKSRSAVEI